jgi:preprotein translocase SecE subunit
VARNRQRARPARPSARRRSDPLPASTGAGQPPIEEDPPVAFDDGDDGPAPEDASVTAAAAFGAPEAEHPQRRVNIITRTIGFLEGCWAELKRVQWPDRPQVVQATGVVLFFVALMGVFLGVADLIAGKIVNAII